MSRKTIAQSTSLDDIGRVALTEAADDQREQTQRLVNIAAIGPEPGEFGRSAKFEQMRLLHPSDFTST